MALRVTQTFKRSKLKKWSKEQGFDELCKEEEDKRCANDLMYTIFKRPEDCIPTLFPRLLDLIEKKYAPNLSQSRVYTDTMAKTKDHSDLNLRVFLTLLIIAREEEAQQVIKSAYKEESIWRFKSSSRFDRTYIPILKAIIDQAFKEPFGEVNIVQIVTWVVVEAEKMYMQK